MSEQLGYEEALLALVMQSQGFQPQNSVDQARVSIATAAPEIRAALARGPQGKADVPIERVATCAFCDATRCNWELAQRNADEWKARALAAETERAIWSADRAAWQECNESLAQRSHDWQKRALAAEARVKELVEQFRDTVTTKYHDAIVADWHKEVVDLKARLTDAALVEAGWIPMSVAASSLSEHYLRGNVDRWLSARAQQAKGGS